MWISDATKISLPTAICRDVVLWIWVARVFELHDQFEEATAVVIRKGAKAIDTLELPTPDLVSSECSHPSLRSLLTTFEDEIDPQRCLAIEAVINELHTLVDKFRSVDYVCPLGSQHSFFCGSVLLGALTKELDRWEMLSPRPEVPFQNMSLSGLRTQLKRRQGNSPSTCIPGDTRIMCA